MSPACAHITTIPGTFTHITPHSPKIFQITEIAPYQPLCVGKLPKSARDAQNGRPPLPLPGLELYTQYMEDIGWTLGENTMARDKHIWKELNMLNVLHQELASLYRTNSTDEKRKALLWRAIEEREALLFLEGVTVG